MTNVYLEKIAAMNTAEKVGYGSSAGILAASGAAEVGNFANSSIRQHKVAKVFVKANELGKNDNHIHKLYEKVYSKHRNRAASIRKYTRLGSRASVAGAALGIAGSLTERITSND